MTKFTAPAPIRELVDEMERNLVHLELLVSDDAGATADRSPVVPAPEPPD